MILYKVGWFQIKFCFQLKGSVFPFALCVAFPCSLLSIFLKCMDYYALEDSLVKQALADVYIVQPLSETAAFGGFNFLVGFIIVFRTSQAYGRFQDALGTTHAMIGEWFDAAGSLVAFCKLSKASGQETTAFLHTVLRLISLLSATALEELTDPDGQIHDFDEDCFGGFETLDAAGLNADCIKALEGCGTKVVVVYQWIQQLVIQNIQTGVLDIPAPILARVYNELGLGMHMFHDGLKIAKVPFPFPYAQTTVTLLIMHWWLCPLVMAQWVSHWWAAGIFTFVQVFILWALNAIATGIESPFGGQENDIDPYVMQRSMNAQLMLLLNPKYVGKTPTLADTTSLEYSSLLKRFAAERRRKDRHVERFVEKRDRYVAWRIWLRLKRRICCCCYRRLKLRDAFRDDPIGLEKEIEGRARGRRGSIPQVEGAHGPAAALTQSVPVGHFRRPLVETDRAYVPVSGTRELGAPEALGVPVQVVSAWTPATEKRMHKDDDASSDFASVVPSVTPLTGKPPSSSGTEEEPLKIESFHAPTGDSGESAAEDVSVDGTTSWKFGASPKPSGSASPAVPSSAESAEDLYEPSQPLLESRRASEASRADSAAASPDDLPGSVARQTIGLDTMMRSRSAIAETDVYEVSRTRSAGSAQAQVHTHTAASEASSFPIQLPHLPGLARRLLTAVAVIHEEEVDMEDGSTTAAQAVADISVGAAYGSERYGSERAERLDSRASARDDRTTHQSSVRDDRTSRQSVTLYSSHASGALLELREQDGEDARTVFVGDEDEDEDVQGRHLGRLTTAEIEEDLAEHAGFLPFSA